MLLTEHASRERNNGWFLRTPRSVLELARCTIETPISVLGHPPLFYSFSSWVVYPYMTVLERWHQGCHNGSQLERELRAKGYKGSPRAIYRYLETLEPSGFSARKHGSASVTRQTASSIQPDPLLTLSAQQATWLFFRKQEDLKEEEQERLRLLRQTSPQVETTYQLVERFLHMVRERTGEQLDAWLGAVEASHLEAFQSFVTGVQQDKDAVLAGLTLPWSNDYVA